MRPLLLLALSASASTPSLLERDATPTAISDAAVGEHTILGTSFVQPPRHLGPLFRAPAEPSLDQVRKHLQAHDNRAALWEARRYTDAHRWGRQRDAAWMVQGMIHREEGRHNLASAAFTKVRSAKGPLAAWGAFHEAEQDLARGRPWVAARECEKYRETYPNGRHRDACHQIIAVSYARAGSWKKARQTAAEYDAEHRKAPIGEQIELTLTMGALDDPSDAVIRRLQQHAIDFEAPLTGSLAVRTLADLAADGNEDARVPDDLASRRRRALSLRNTKQTHAAWAVFEALAVDSEDDPALRRWVESEAETFGWRTRNWDFLAEYYTDQVERFGRPDDAWKHYRVLTRGGRHAEAVEVARVGLAKHKGNRHWRRKEEELGRTHLLAKDYTGAQGFFDAVARRGGWTGRRGRFYAAFAGVMGGSDDADTLKRLGQIVSANGSWSTAARYWRAQVLDRTDAAEEARADLDSVIASAPDDWYAVLARQRIARDRTDLVRRSGRWPGDPLPQPIVFSGDPAPHYLEQLPLARNVISAPRQSATGFGNLVWGAPPLPDPEPTPLPSMLLADPNSPPDLGLPPSQFSQAEAFKEVLEWTERNAGAWPDLKAAFDLSRAGLYDESGPLFSAIYEEWRRAYRSSGNRKHAAARRMKLTSDEWRVTFNFMGDHHHAARFNHSRWMDVEDPALARDTRKLGYPLAHARYIWTHAREHDVDPFLVLGLMRQESTYNSIARSPVGARGAMQIMPKTGHLMANILDDRDYNAGDLEDPTFAVGYGIAYLGLLLDRFEGAYPLAIASYNGGPFNVSSWLRGTGQDMPMDAFVEHIPFRETRDYVKKVSSGYNAYLSLYAPPDTVLSPPETPLGDHPQIIDF